MSVVFEKLKSDIASAEAEYVQLLTKNMNQVIKIVWEKYFHSFSKRGVEK